MHTNTMKFGQLSLLDLFALVTVAGVITWATLSIARDYKKAHDGPPIHWSSLWSHK